ncbi:penicillin-binding protein, 1A family [Beggiatoa sp. PS]|nr:penicillin-binding protein, 1A family [Beggiatoa sp. PS]
MLLKWFVHFCKSNLVKKPFIMDIGFIPPLIVPYNRKPQQLYVDDYSVMIKYVVLKKLKAKNHQSIPKEANVEEWADNVLRKYHILGDLVPSVVLSVSAHSINAYNRLSGRFRIRWRDIAWTRRYASRIVKRGDIIMVRPMTKLKSSNENDQKTIYQESSQAKFKNIRWRLSQVPEIEGALVAMNPKDGAITALVGGFDFYNSKFNRATQAKRQPGSTFKPFIYSAALARGYSPGSSINDAPIVFRVGGGRWRPKNYSHKYYGWTSLRKALAYSHNVSAVRLLNKVGVTYTIDHLEKFGFDPKKIPRNLTIALGTGEVTPLELTAGFAVFANGGFRVEPYFIDHIKDFNGKVVFSANPRKICSKCPNDILEYSKEQPYNSLVSHQDCSRIPRYAPQAISANNAYHMTSMLKGVIQFGTARKARVLRRSDLAGKTGTTNNQRDAWFAGYSPNNIVTTVWMGFDRPRSLGYRATGGNTALPMWLDFMSHALRGKSLKSIPKSYGSVAQKPTTSRQVRTRSSSRSSTPSRSSRSSRNSRSSRTPSKKKSSCS